MELEDLKTTWKSLGNEIEHIARNSKDEIIINNNQDIKTSLINRFRWGAGMLIVGTYQDADLVALRVLPSIYIWHYSHISPNCNGTKNKSWRRLPCAGDGANLVNQKIL